ncbi:hypothetical protein vseg_015170 [Gypsophila vaccaria]
MVLSLRPSKFYGSSLPRPRIYTDVKFSDERVDPPTPVLEPLLSWANDAHWSMGGLSFNRLRLQGKIEGNVQKLRKQQEKSFKSTPQKSSRATKNMQGKSVDSPPPAPVAKKMKLRSRTVSVDGEDEEEQTGGVRKKTRRLVRKLGEDFEFVANESEESEKRLTKVGPKTQRRKMVLMEEEEEKADDDAGTADEGAGNSENGKRSSPRLKKKLN